MSDLITRIASDKALDEAYHWLCKRREKLSHNNDVWALRRHWQEIKPELQQTLLNGEYRFSPQVELRLPDGNLECWCAVDSLLLKAMTIVLGELWNRSSPPLAPTWQVTGVQRKPFVMFFISCPRTVM